MAVKCDLFWQTRAPPLPVSQLLCARRFTNILGERGPVAAWDQAKFWEVSSSHWEH